LSLITVFLDSSSADGKYQNKVSSLLSSHRLLHHYSVALHFSFFPFENMELNYLESIGLLVSMTTLYLGLWTFSDSAAADGTPGSFVVTILILTVNGAWLLCVIAVLLAAFGL
jgi:hypothetical protein